MSKPYFAVVAASVGYQPCLSALINSFRIYHDGQGIHILIGDCGLEQEFKDKYDGDDITWIPIHSDRGHIWATKFERFRIAVEQTGAIVGIFDADMYVVRSMLNMWKMAEAGFIVGGSNASNIRFGSDWNEKYGMEVPDVWNTKTITSVPTFMDIDLHGEVWSEIYRHKTETNMGADFNLLNIFICKLNKLEHVIPFSSAQNTGVHHQQVKPSTGIILKAGELLTGNGLELFCVHGRFHSGDWYANLLKPMPKHLARMGIRSKRSRAYQSVLKSRQLLMDEFNKYCDWPYESTVKDATLANIKEQEDLFFTNTATMEEENEKLLKEQEVLRKEIYELKKQLDELGSAFPKM